MIIQTITGAAGGGSGGGYANGGYATNRFYCGLGNYLSTGVSTGTLNEQMYQPFVVGKTTTFTRIGIRCSTAVALSNVRLGIYNSANGVPTTLLLDAGSVATTLTGDKEITISQSLSAGLYYTAINRSASAIELGQYQTSRGEFLMDYWGMPDSGATGIPQSAYHSQTFGAMPANAAALTYYYGAGGQDNPGIWLRVV